MPVLPYILTLLSILVLLSTANCATQNSLKLTHVDLAPYLNNKAAAPTGQLAGFNEGNESYPAEHLPTGIFQDKGFSVGSLSPFLRKLR